MSSSGPNIALSKKLCELKARNLAHFISLVKKGVQEKRAVASGARKKSFCSDDGKNLRSYLPAVTATFLDRKRHCVQNSPRTTAMWHHTRNKALMVRT